MLLLRRIFFLCFLIFSSFPLTAVGGPDDHPYPEVVKIITTNADGELLWGGTGFFISPDMLVTAAHVASEGSVYIDLGDQFIPTTVLTINEGYDLAILKALDYETEHFYSLGSLDNVLSDFLIRFKYEEKNVFHPREIKKGDSVVIPGFSGDLFNFIFGIFVGNSEYFMVVQTVLVGTTIEIDTFYKEYTFNGMSGAPVFLSGDDGEQKLVGILTRSSEELPFENIIFTPVEILRTLIGKKPLISPTDKETNLLDQYNYESWGQTN